MLPKSSSNFFHQTFFHDVDSSLSIETEYFYKFIIKIRLKKVYKNTCIYMELCCIIEAKNRFGERKEVSVEQTYKYSYKSRR